MMGIATYFTKRNREQEGFPVGAIKDEKMNAPSQLGFNIGAYVQKEKELEDYLATRQEAFDAEMKPYKDGIAALKTACLQFLIDSGQQNAKTEHGTAYQQTTMSVKVDNPVDLQKFVIANSRWDMIQWAVLKDPVKDWLDQNNGTPPPGVKIEFFTKCNIRRS